MKPMSQQNFLKTKNLVIAVLLLLLITTIAYYNNNHNFNEPVNKKHEHPEYLAKKDLHQELKQFLLENPQVIVESLQNLQKKQANENASLVKENVKNNHAKLYEGNSPKIGDEGPKLVLFMDYRCGYCRKFDDVLNQFKADNKLQVIQKHFPVLGENSIKMAKFALAVNKVAPTKYAKINEELYNMRHFSEAALKEILVKNEIDTEEVFASINDAAIEQELNDNMSLAAALKIRGTPAIIINDQFIAGAIPLSELKKILK